jgi:hypothetical protein
VLHGFPYRGTRIKCIQKKKKVLVTFKLSLPVAAVGPHGKERMNGLQENDDGSIGNLGLEKWRGKMVVVCDFY